MNIYSLIRILSKSVKAQNLFLASKEIYGIKLFRNDFNFSKIQEIYLSYLYNYDSINKDIIIDKISKHVTDDEIYTDAYLLYKSKNINKTTKDNKQNEIHLVTGKNIKFKK